MKKTTRTAICTALAVLAIIATGLSLRLASTAEAADQLAQSTSAILESRAI